MPYFLLQSGPEYSLTGFHPFDQTVFTGYEKLLEYSHNDIKIFSGQEKRLPENGRKAGKIKYGHSIIVVCGLLYDAALAEGPGVNLEKVVNLLKMTHDKK